MQKRPAYKSILSSAIWFLALLLISPLAHAQTPPILRISDNAGNVVTVDSTGTVTFSGNPSCVAMVTCNTVSVTAFPGLIQWRGSIGAFTLSSQTGVTKPLAAPPVIDLTVREVTSSTGGTVTVEWTDTAFSVPGGTTASMAGGGTINGTASITFKGYMDNSNTAFGTGVTVVGTGPFTTPSYSAGLTGPGTNSSPFSMTESVTFVMGPNSTAGGDFELHATPTPCTGAIGDFVWIDTNSNGIQDASELGLNGVTVQLYKGAVLPANLVATTVTGPVPPGYTFLTPGAPGYYQFPGLCGGNVQRCSRRQFAGQPTRPLRLCSQHQHGRASR